MKLKYLIFLTTLAVLLGSCGSSNTANTSGGPANLLTAVYSSFRGDDFSFTSKNQELNTLVSSSQLSPNIYDKTVNGGPAVAVDGSIFIGTTDGLFKLNRDSQTIDIAPGTASLAGNFVAPFIVNNLVVSATNNTLYGVDTSGTQSPISSTLANAAEILSVIYASSINELRVIYTSGGSLFSQPVTILDTDGTQTFAIDPSQAKTLAGSYDADNTYRTLFSNSKVIIGEFENHSWRGHHDNTLLRTIIEDTAGIAAGSAEKVNSEFGNTYFFSSEGILYTGSESFENGIDRYPSTHLKTLNLGSGEISFTEETVNDKQVSLTIDNNNQPIRIEYDITDHKIETILGVLTASGTGASKEVQSSTIQITRGSETVTKNIYGSDNQINSVTQALSSEIISTTDRNNLYYAYAVSKQKDTVSPSNDIISVNDEGNVVLDLVIAQQPIANLNNEPNYRHLELRLAASTGQDFVDVIFHSIDVTEIGLFLNLTVKYAEDINGSSIPNYVEESFFVHLAK